MPKTTLPTASSTATSQVPAMDTAALHDSIRNLLLAAKAQVRQTVNTTMVRTYWQVGRLIVEGKQGGEKRAAYGKQVLPELSQRLTEEFGGGFSVQSLSNYRQFYLQFPIFSAVRRELTWTHYKSLLRIENPTAREWYAVEAAQQGWSVRALDRQIASLFYERLLAACRTQGFKTSPPENCLKNRQFDLVFVDFQGFLQYSQPLSNFWT